MRYKINNDWIVDMGGAHGRNSFGLCKISKKTVLVDNSINKAEKQIELLQEYRTALISEAVTGKIDVREAV